MRKLIYQIVTPLAVFTPFTALGAQEITHMDETAIKAAAGVFFMAILLVLMIFITAYIYMAICLMKIAEKTNVTNAWLAWIPIVNIYLMIKIAEKEIWWIILFFIPFVNIVIGVLIWMAISKKLNQPEWLGVLMVVPIANLVLPGYLAFSDSAKISASMETNKSA